MKTTFKKTIRRNGRWIGKWTEPKTHTPIIVCTCGNKYIKSREGQLLCLKCSLIPVIELVKK